MAEQNGTNTGKCAEEYVVKRGDSFYLIAHKLGVPLRDLLAANRDIHPARLMVGDVLCVPREEDDSPQTGGLGGSGTTQTTQTTGTTQTTQATGAAPSTGMTQTTQATGTAPSTGMTQSTQVTGMAQATGTTQTTQVTGTVQATGTTQTTQVTGTVQATGTTQATGATQATGTTQAVQPTCMTGQIAPDTTLSCTEDEQWTVQKGQTVSDLQLRGLVSRHTLETANPGVDFENLRVGQSVCIPKDNVPCELPETYTLAATETLEAVAMRFNLPVASLLRANPCLAPQDFEG
ncbi:MAG TPA: LysM peptidoglycan-binding domain-containing protein, partial [Candidatus Limiplasma merdipullorum]|nr:LysM peptidoglycan-binding domain-containing protein [Candidatus Limiplasma merdipullorum]